MIVSEDNSSPAAVPPDRSKRADTTRYGSNFSNTDMPGSASGLESTFPRHNIGLDRATFW